MLPALSFRLRVLTERLCPPRDLDAEIDDLDETRVCVHVRPERFAKNAPSRPRFGIHVRRLDAGHFRVAHPLRGVEKELRANPGRLESGQTASRSHGVLGRRELTRIDTKLRIPLRRQCVRPRRQTRALRKLGGGEVSSGSPRRRPRGGARRRRTSVRARGDGRGEHVQPRGDESVGDDRVTRSPGRVDDGAGSYCA